MNAATESVVLLSRALDQTGDVLARVRPDQLGLSTPCVDWDVAHLIGHLVTTPRSLLAMARGEQVDWSAGPQPAEGEWAAEFQAAADDLLHHWHQVEDSADPNQVDWQTAELAVHTWDLARATGQSTDLDEEVALRGLAFMSDMLTEKNRGDAFGPAVPVPENAPAYDRIAAFAGRDPR